MKNTIFIATLIGTIIVFMSIGGAGAASHGHADHAGGAAPAVGQEHQQLKEVAVQAEVLGVAADGSAVEIDHPPIPELGWPAMQMSLDLAGPGLADGIAAGDTVLVTIKQLSATQYVISEISKQ